MKIWQRYLLRQLATLFTVVLLCIFAVYVMVDLSIHGVRFLSKESAGGSELVIYYLRSFAAHFDLFIPLSFLLSSLKVLFDFNSRFEQVALLMAGVPRKKLLVPFFGFALCLTIFSYVNGEWLSPVATYEAQEFKIAHSKHKKKFRRDRVHAIALEDESELVYQHFDQTERALCDVFWIRSPQDIWHFKTLRIGVSPVTGICADHFLRTPKLEKAESFPLISLPQLALGQEIAPHPFVPFECRPISTLFYEALHASADRASVRTHLHYKLALPFLSPLLLCAIAPFCLSFNRNRPTYLIVALSLSMLIAMMILFDSLLILGANQVLPSWVAIWTPLGIAFAASFRRFARL